MAEHTNKINVLWLVDHLGYGGFMHGAGKFYLDTIPLLDENKINVTLCVLRSRDHLTKLFEDRGVRILHLGRNKFDPRTITDLIKIIRKEKIELIHCHGYGSDNFGRMVGGLFRIPTIVHAHDDNFNYPWHQNLADLLLRRFTKKAIAISESVKRSCVTKRKICPNKLSVIHNGILLNNFNTIEKELIQKERKHLGIKLDSKIVGTVARLRAEKGIKYLIESAPKILEIFPDTIFLIAGDGPLREELQNLASQLGIQDKVLFMGFRQDIPAVLSVIDVFVAPSETEGLGLGILEAMAIGKPIVATSVGGIIEILKDGETGYLVPAKNSQELAKRVIYMLKNEEEARCLGIKAREESRKYDINSNVKKIEEQYFGLITSNN